MACTDPTFDIVTKPGDDCCKYDDRNNDSHDNETSDDDGDAGDECDNSAVDG